MPWLLVQPERLTRLTQEQAEALAILIMTRDSSETLALLPLRGLLCAERDDHATGRRLGYPPTPRLL